MNDAPQNLRQRQPGLRVAVIAYTEYPWDPRVRGEAESLAADGYVVHAITPRPRSGPSSTHLGGVHLHELPITIRRGGKLCYLYQYAMFFLLTLVLLLHLHLRHRFSLVHVHSLPDFQVFAALPLRLSHAAILLDLHEAMPEILAARFALPPRNLWVLLATLSEAVSWRFADHVIAANEGIRSALIRRGVPQSRITAVYNPGDASISADPQTVRAELDLPPGRLIVHAGGINSERDIETLIRAFASLPDSVDAHLVLAGDGESAYISELTELAQRLGVAKRVRFTGKLSRERALALMSLSSVGVVTLEANPLTELAWPTRIAEFAHMRKPLILPKLRFVWETLRDGAQFYHPGDPDGLAAELLSAIEAPARFEAAIDRAETICNRFESSRMRALLRAVYNGLEGSIVAEAR